MNRDFANGDTAYIIESNHSITKVRVGNIQNGFCIAKYGARCESAIRIRMSRLYKTEEEATAALNKQKRDIRSIFRR